MTGLRRRAARRIAVAGLGLSVLPAFAAVAAVRPAAAAVTAGPGAALSRFGITTDAAAVTSSGTVAAGGGLVLTDQGAATVTGRLDNSPSSNATAVAVEPGETVRTLSGSSGGPTVPGAAAQYPGGPATSTDTTVGSTSAQAGPTAAAASSTAASAGTGDVASASEKLAANTDGTLLSASSTSDSGTLTVAGVLTLTGVVGTAAISYDSEGQHATAGITIASATVAGTPVTIDSSGVHVLGTSPVPAGVLPTGPPAPVDAILAAAGISITLLDPVMTTTATGAFADSGALTIHESTPDLTSGLTTVSSATDITLYLGRAEATLSDAPAQPAEVVPTEAASSAAVVAPTTAAALPTVAASSPAAVVPGTPAVPGRTVTTVLGGGVPPAAAPVHPAGSAPTAGAATRARPAAVQVLGYRLADSQALAGFATWQLLTLGIATTAAMVARRRDEPEEEHLCPCP